MTNGLAFESPGDEQREDEEASGVAGEQRVDLPVER